nr:sigma 54-dependent Fis family transcriptional regulator [Deltaproteobacteria bacterium]
MDTLATFAVNAPVGTVASFQLEVIAGPDAGSSARSVEGRLIVGTAEGVTLRLTDPTVSRFHAEFEAAAQGVLLRDLGSTNGTLVRDVLLREGTVLGAVELELGRTRIRLVTDRDRALVALSPEGRFRRADRRLGGDAGDLRDARAGSPDDGPSARSSGVRHGEGLAAHSIHRASPRAAGPFEVVDCRAPSDPGGEHLFGHEKGTFTGAHAASVGAFERAHGGTIFLDELGELPMELQAKLLRVLGEGEVRRLGATATRKVDVRVLAATNRDLRREVNAGRFRADLYYRIAVVQVRMPALRERLEDLPHIVPAVLERIARERRLGTPASVDAALLQTLSQHAWPGNVRELRNWLEQYAILQVRPAFGPGDDAPPERLPGAEDHAVSDTWPPAQSAPPGASEPTDLLAGLDNLPLREAKRELVDRFERAYLRKMLEDVGGNVAEVARRAGVDRATVFRTLRRVGVREG